MYYDIFTITKHRWNEGKPQAWVF